MQLSTALLFASVPAASAQLFGLGGSSCPQFKIDVMNTDYDEDASGHLLIVFHDPAWSPVSHFIPNTAAKSIINSSNRQVTAAAFGVLNNQYVCGDEDGQGQILVVPDGDWVDYDGGEYDTVYMQPINSNKCSCSDMVLSAVANIDDIDDGMVIAHHRVNLEQKTWVRSEDDLEYWDDEDFNSPALATHSYADYGDSPDDDALLFEIEPIVSSSTSILSLWALLLGGWY